MSEFLIKFLKKRYNTDMNAFEYSYALNEVFEKTNDNEYIQQFAGILNGKVDSLKKSSISYATNCAIGFKVDEEVYVNEQKVIKKLLDLLKDGEKDENSNNVIGSIN